MGTATQSVFENLIQTSTDTTNQYMRDIFFPATGSACSSSDMNSFDFKVQVADTCWENVHPDHLQVFVFNYWVGKHPGGPDKIVQFADVQKSWFLTFPGWHDMGR